MKYLKGFFIIALLLMSTTFMFGMGMTPVEFIESGVLVAAITPVVVWLATQFFTWVWPKIPTAMVFLIVSILSWGYTQISGVYEAGEATYILQILTGIGSTFLNELLKLAGAKSSLTKAAEKRGIERIKSVV